jgi:Aminotransferase class-V
MVRAMYGVDGSAKAWLVEGSIKAAPVTIEQKAAEILAGDEDVPPKEADTIGPYRPCTIPPVALVGDGLPVPCLDGKLRPYLNLDAAASTNALPAVVEQVQRLLPWYSSVHRGAGYKSRLPTEAYEQARDSALRFAGRPADGHDVAIICRNTTDAINHLAYRLRLQPDDVVVTTVIEHHANLLPWARVCQHRFVECGQMAPSTSRPLLQPWLNDPVRGCWRSPQPRTCQDGCLRSKTSSTPLTSRAYPCWWTPLS